MPARDRAHRVGEILGPGPLEQEAARTGPEGAKRVVVELERRQHDDAWPVLGTSQRDPLCRLDAVGAGELHIHEDDVGGDLGDQRVSLPHARALADHLDVGFRVHDDAESDTGRGVVVDDDHANRRALKLGQPCQIGSSGSSAVTQ